MALIVFLFEEFLSTVVHLGNLVNRSGRGGRIVGVGLGGTFEKAAELSKHALFRKIGSNNEREDLDKMEKELLSKINDLGIGAQGFGGKTSALGLFIEAYPTHISSLPVAINILCHCSRCAEFTIGGKD